MRYREYLTCTAFLGIAALISVQSRAADVHVSNFGAFPDDNQCDIAAIQSAITAASAGLPRILRFDAGVYNLTDPVTGQTPLITIQNANALTVIGAVDPNGQPATVLQRNIAVGLTNEMDLADVLEVEGGGNITLQNLAIDNSPEFASAGVCVRVDEPNDVVEVDVFAGLPHFDGMQAFSANAWNLLSRDLIGGVEHLTIGTDVSKFTQQWQHVPGGDGRRYRMANMGFAAKLNIGDGVSWHFNVIDAGAQLSSIDTNSLTLENITFHNAPAALATLLNVNNLTCRRVVLEPRGNQLAVGPRDGFFLNLARGEYIFEDCYFKGVRWDPISLFNRFVFVEQMLGQNSAEVFWYSNSNTPLNNLNATLWFSSGPATATIDSFTWGDTDTDGSGNTIRRGTVTFSDNLPTGFGAGDSFSPHMRSLTEFRNCTFESNYGRSPYLSGVNMLIEDCTFRNNGYAFALGPSSLGAGAFCRNVVIRGNSFSDCVWSITTQPPTSGAIRLYENNTGHFENESYNDNILIESNTFSNIDFGPQFAAIDVQNAQNVTIRCNTYTDTPNTVQIQEDSTQLINIVNDGLPDGCQACPGTIIAADFNDMLPGAMRDDDGQLPSTGIGFAEDYWSAGTAQIRVVPGDLSAPAVTGYSVVQSPPAQRVQGVFPTADRRQARQTVSVYGSPEIWISFLAQNDEATDVAGIDLMETSSYDPTPTTTLRKIVLEGTTLKVVSSGTGGGTVDLSSKIALGQTALLLAKLMPNALSQAEQIDVWVNPDVSIGAAGLPAPDFTQAGDLGWDMDSITWLGIQSYDTGPSGIGGFVDSIRISEGPCAFDFVVAKRPDLCEFTWPDYQHFEACLAGPGGSLTSSCLCSDIDSDTDIDVQDLSLLQQLFIAGPIQ